MALFALAYAAFAVFATLQGLAGNAWWFVITVFAVPVVPLLLFGAGYLVATRNACRRPVWATVVSVTALPSAEIGPLTCVATLAPDSQPDQPRRINFVEGLSVEPGMRLLIVVTGSTSRWLS